MAAEDPEPRYAWLAPGFLMSSALSWSLIALGMALMYLFPAPSLLKQIPQYGGHRTLQDLGALAHLFAITIIPILGFWRLSTPLGLPRLLALLYLLSPIVTLGIYLARTFLDRTLPDS